MAFLSPEDFNNRDIFLYYDYEGAFLRYEHKGQRYFLKLDNGQPEYQRPYDNRLVNDVIRFGKEVSAPDDEICHVPYMCAMGSGGKGVLHLNESLIFQCDNLA